MDLSKYKNSTLMEVCIYIKIVLLAHIINKKCRHIINKNTSHHSTFCTKQTYHRRFILQTGGDALQHHHQRFVLRTVGDEVHHRRFQQPLRPPTLEPAVMRHHRRFILNRR